MISEPLWTRSLAGARRLARHAALAAGRGAARDLTIVLAGDDEVSRLNARFRATPVATNVLAFPAAANPHDHLGDVILAFGVCAREARDQGKPLGDHMRHLVIHGVLHLMGYDHQTDDEAGRMEAMETVALASLGVPDPYLNALDRGETHPA